ncbi:hypothetical protein D3C86_1660460 [compost metagenome]
MTRIHGRHEQRPAVLEVRHEPHAKDADEELEPAIAEQAALPVQIAIAKGGACRVRVRHVVSPCISVSRALAARLVGRPAWGRPTSLLNERA